MYQIKLVCAKQGANTIKMPFLTHFTPISWHFTIPELNVIICWAFGTLKTKVGRQIKTNVRIHSHFNAKPAFYFTPFFRPLKTKLNGYTATFILYFCLDDHEKTQFYLRLVKFYIKMS